MGRAGLSRAAVADAAAALVDEVGWDALTLSLLAARLGVKVPSLYKHVSSLAALRADLATRALGELRAALTGATVGRSGPAAVRALATAYRDYARRHPGRYAATVGAPTPDDEAHRRAAASVTALVYAVLDRCGLDGDAAVDATRALRAVVHGFVHLELAGGFGLPHDTDRSFAYLVDRLVAGLTAP